MRRDIDTSTSQPLHIPIPTNKHIFQAHREKSLSRWIYLFSPPTMIYSTEIAPKPPPPDPGPRPMSKGDLEHKWHLYSDRPDSCGVLVARSDNKPWEGLALAVRNDLPPALGSDSQEPRENWEVPDATKLVGTFFGALPRRHRLLPIWQAAREEGEESLPNKLTNVSDQLGVRWTCLMPCSYEMNNKDKSHELSHELYFQNQNRPPVLLAGVKRRSTSRETGKVAVDRCAQVIRSLATEEGEMDDVQVRMVEMRTWGAFPDSDLE